MTPKFPRAVFVEATNRCNLRCVMCPTPTMKRPRGFLTSDTLRHVIRGLPEGTPVGLSNWGEPLLHPGIEQLVSLLAEAGYRPEMVTNATLLTEDKARALIAAGLARLFISVDGVGETYEQIRGYPFDQLLERIEQLLSIRPPSMEVRLRVTLQQANESSFRQVAARFEGRVNDISVQRQLTWKPSARPRGACPYLFSYLYFLWDGTAVPCCVDHSAALVVGQASATEAAATIWRGAALEALRQRHLAGDYPPLCLACDEWEGGDPDIGYRFREHEAWSITPRSDTPRSDTPRSDTSGQPDE